MNRWTESDALDPMFEKPRKAQVVRIKIEVVSLGSTSMAPSLDGPLLAGSGRQGSRAVANRHEKVTVWS